MTDVSFVAIDWGTSSFRLWAMNASGKVRAEKRSKAGMSSLTRPDYEDVLEGTLAELGLGAEVPVIICGMAGAAQGWHEARYIDLPARLNAIATGAVKVPTRGRDVRILPGLAQREAAAPDVMRGEETLLLGAALEKSVSGRICLPGTHAKWAMIENDSVVRFSTAMTGEIFALLAKRSVLSHFMPEDIGDVAENPAFEAAIHEILDAPEKLLNLLFSVRATPLLFKATTNQAMCARLSGLLMGAEIAASGACAGDQVTLISGDALQPGYNKAFAVAGLKTAMLNAEDMARAGLCQAARNLWPHIFS